MERYFFGGIVSVELLAPQFGIHLKLDVDEVDVSLHGIHVSFCHVIVTVLFPVVVLKEVAQLFPEIT